MLCWMPSGNSTSEVTSSRCTTTKWNLEPPAMTIDVVMIQPIVALVAGVLIPLIPRLLSFIVAVYLILIGIVGLWPGLHLTH
jgi:hypothetical protein